MNLIRRDAHELRTPLVMLEWHEHYDDLDTPLDPSEWGFILLLLVFICGVIWLVVSHAGLLHAFL